MQELSGFGCLGGGGDDGFAVFFEDSQPALDVGGVVFAGLGVDLQIGTEKRGRKFRH